MDLLIIRPGALGDTLMLVPALIDLSGKGAITFVGRQPGLEFVRPHVDRSMDLEASGWHRLFMNRLDGAFLPVENAEVVAAFFNDEDGVIRRNLRSCLPHASVHLSRSFPLKEEDVHVAEYLAHCLKSAGLPVDPVRSIEAVKKGVLCEKARLSERRAGIRKKIILHPGSGSLEKNHPPDFWLELVTRFGRDAEFKGLERVVLLGPAEESLYPFFTENLRSGDAEILLSSSKEALMEILGEAALCLGHDSGVTHLSAMWCVPTVALFKKSNAIQWAPPGPSVRVIQDRNPGLELLEGVLEVSRRFLDVQGLSNRRVVQRGSES